MKNLIKSIAVIALVFASVSCSDSKTNEQKEFGTASIARIVEATPSFSNFNDALEITGLKSMLEGSGKYTVFIPNDDAFAAVLGGMSVEDFNTANPGVLESVIKYHIVPNGVLVKDLTDGQTIATSLSGQTIGVTLEANPYFPEYDETLGGYEETSYYLNSVARIYGRDVKCTNGTVNEIDSVLQP